LSVLVFIGFFKDAERSTNHQKILSRNRKISPDNIFLSPDVTIKFSREFETASVEGVETSNDRLSTLGPALAWTGEKMGKASEERQKNRFFVWLYALFLLFLQCPSRR